MKSSFPKRDKRHFNKWPCNVNDRFIGFEKISSYMYICIYLYIFMKSAFLKHGLRILYWHCKLNFWICAYYVLEKSSSYIQDTYETYKAHIYMLYICAIYMLYIFQCIRHIYDFIFLRSIPDCGDRIGKSARFPYGRSQVLILVGSNR